MEANFAGVDGGLVDMAGIILGIRPDNCKLCCIYRSRCHLTLECSPVSMGTPEHAVKDAAQIKGNGLGLSGATCSSTALSYSCVCLCVFLKIAAMFLGPGACGRPLQHTVLTGMYEKGHSFVLAVGNQL